jgi:hypothetical protein
MNIEINLEDVFGPPRSKKEFVTVYSKQLINDHIHVHVRVRTCTLYSIYGR